jgi:hypothetical protein
MFNYLQTQNPITSMEISPKQQPSTVSFLTPSENIQTMNQASGFQAPGFQAPGFQAPGFQAPGFQAPLTIPTLNHPPRIAKHPTKKIKIAHSGINIVNKIDYDKVGNDFVQFYYKNINTVQPIVPYLRQSTIFKFNSEENAYSKLPALFDKLKKYTYNIEKVEVLPSGSRRLDIMVSGNITGAGKFSQYFLLCNEKEQQWYLKSSILV